MLNLYILRPLKPWSERWDVCNGFLVVAEDEDQARALAEDSEYVGDETHIHEYPWQTEAHTSCTHIGTSNIYDTPHVLMYDFHAG